jgi:hypothetical protein
MIATTPLPCPCTGYRFSGYLNQLLKWLIKVTIKTTERGREDQDEEEDDEGLVVTGPMRELWFWELCYHRCGYRLVLTKIIRIA